MNKVKISGAIASKSGAVLYLENGEEVNLSAEKWGTAVILKKITPALARRETVTIDLDEYRLERRIEKKTGGLLRFVREKVSNFFAKRTGVLDPETDDTTLVAIVGDKKIPGVEALEKQMEHALQTDNTVGLQRFLERIATVIDERGHTVQELLNFMKKGDLPIANDGSIIAYKRLRSKDGRYLDPYSEKVSQGLGSHVSMPVDMVDEDRRQQCSTGLHIGRRGYMGRFYGNVICIVKIAPEDVVAVPENEPDKMRVAAYHIVAELDPPAFDLVVANKPMTAHEPSAQLLGKIIAGDHIGITDYVRVEKSGVTITAADGTVRMPSQKAAKPVKTVDEVNPDVMDISELNRVKNAAMTVASTAAISKKAVTPKTPAPSSGEKTPIDLALEAVRAGMSQRDAVKKFKVCAKTIRKRLKTDS